MTICCAADASSAALPGPPHIQAEAAEHHVSELALPAQLPPPSSIGSPVSSAPAAASAEQTSSCVAPLKAADSTCGPLGSNQQREDVGSVPVIVSAAQSADMNLDTADVLHTEVSVGGRH